MALRRVARRLTASVPSPLPVSGFRGRLRFFSASSPTPPPHFMAEYLVTTCGLSPAAAAKAAPRFAHLSSTARPDAALAFLRSQGLGRAQVRAIVSRKPALLLSDVDATLSPKFTAVRALGLGRADTARLFALFPSALTYGVHTNLLPRVLFWLDFLGSTRLLMKCLAKTWLLKYSVHLLLQNLSTLRGLGVPDSRVATAVRLQPTIIMQAPAKFQALLARVESCGVPPSSGMYMWSVFALHNVSERTFRAKKAAVMRAAGCTEEEFAAMFHRAPCFVFASQELLRRKVEFLKATVGCSAGHLIRNPVMLTLSLEKRMLPRCRAMEALRSKGVDIGKPGMAHVMRLSEASFVEKYVRRYMEELPELLELYPQAEGYLRQG